MGVRLWQRHFTEGTAPAFLRRHPRIYALAVLSIVVVGLYPAEAGAASEVNLHAKQGTAGTLPHAGPVAVHQASAHALPKSWTVRYSANSIYFSTRALARCYALRLLGALAG